MGNRAPAYRWVIMIMNFFILILGYTALGIWSVALPELTATFKLSNLQIQFGSSAFMAGYAVGSIVEAKWAAKLGFKKAGLIGLVLFVATCFAIPYCPNFGLVLLLRFLQGWGNIWCIATSMTTAWFPVNERGMASGFVGGGLSLGAGAGGIIIAGLMTFIDTWQQCYIVFGIISLVVVVLWTILTKDAPRDLYPEETIASVNTENKRNIKIWKVPVAWLLVLQLFGNAWQGVGLNSVAPDYLYGVGYNTTQASFALLVIGLVGIVITPLGGIVSDLFIRMGMTPIKARVLTMIIGFTWATVTTILWPNVAPIGYLPMVVMAAMAGAGVPFTNGCSGSLPLDLMKDPELAGRMFGFNIFVGIGLSGVFGPIVLTAVGNTFGWMAGFVACAAGTLIALVATILVPKFELKN